MPKRLIGRPTQEVYVPRWVAWARIVWGTFVTVFACIALYLLYQAATRDEEAIRNGQIQSCSSEYAGTYDAHAGLFFRAVSDVAADPTPDLEQLRAEGQAVAEMAARRIGLSIYARTVLGNGDSFTCPPIPESLELEPIYPDGFTPP